MNYLESVQATLGTSLELAVPMWIERHRNTPPEQRVARAAVCGQEVACRGDLLMFKGKRSGESGEVFNRLSEGLALAAFAPGGVTAFGCHWEAK